jgi:hypothetical protein
VEPPSLMGHLYKGKEKVELKQIINDELKKYKVDEHAMAIVFFQKTKNKIDQLWLDLKREFQV